jgi:serine/threonine protein kinase
MEEIKDRMRPKRQLEQRGYKFEKELGEGSYGIVLKVSKNDVVYAAKAIEKQLFLLAPKVRTLTETERNVLMRIHNPNVIRLIESFETPEIFYLILEYANDSDMGSYLKRLET